MLRLLSLAAVAGALLVLACGGDDATECRDDGGHWECKDDTLAECRCATKTKDGGARCDDSGDCDGRCIVKTGICGDESLEAVCESYHAKYSCPEEVLDGECHETC